MAEQYQLSESSLARVVEEVTLGAGFVVLPGVFGPDVVERCLACLGNQVTRAEGDIKEYTEHKDIGQNNFSGLEYGLLEVDPVFLEMAGGEVVHRVATSILGPNCRLSSLSANTLVRGMPSQAPHLDYPYHRPLWPTTGPATMATAPTLSLTFMTPLTAFTPAMGSTTMVPGSQVEPRWPEEDFFQKARQVVGGPGDLVIMSGAVQHTSGSNSTPHPRTVLLQQMVPLYVTPFESLQHSAAVVLEQVPAERRGVWRQYLALDHPLPTRKGPARPGQPRPGQPRPGQTRPGQTRPGMEWRKPGLN